MLKKVLIFLGILLAFAVMAFFLFRSYTKSFSPQEEVVLEDEDLEVVIEYSRPSKKDREIFGDLVPYDEVWRTGANEATTFTTNQDLIIKGEVLPAGGYSLWAIPRKEVWEIIWNSETGQWGVDLDQKANKDPANDVLAVNTTVINTTNTFEKFTINVDQASDEYQLIMMWDRVMVVVPFKKK